MEAPAAGLMPTNVDKLTLTLAYVSSFRFLYVSGAPYYLTASQCSHIVSGVTDWRVRRTTARRQVNDRQNQRLGEKPCGQTSFSLSRMTGAGTPAPTATSPTKAQSTNSSKPPTSTASPRKARSSSTPMCPLQAAPPAEAPYSQAGTSGRPAWAQFSPEQGGTNPYRPTP